MIARDPAKPLRGDLVHIAENQAQYKTLPARVAEDGDVFCVFDFTPEERALIAEGQPLHIRILTFGYALEPFSLAVEGSKEYEDFYE